MRAVAVFCGSALGTNPAHATLAREFGRTLGERGSTLVYGGANVGLMGTLADAALASGADVIGVIPRFLAGRELAHPRLSELVLVDTMLERKTVMFERADAFVALPGGLGTLDELFEALTWTQLGLQNKPAGLLDATGYFAELEAFLDTATREGFVRERERRALIVDSDPACLLDRLTALCTVARG